MSSLEVLQYFLDQRKALLSAFSGLDPTESSLITFYIEHSMPCLSHQIMFQIQVTVMEKFIHRTVIDEGAATSTMSISYWKALESPPITPSPTIL